MSIVTDCFTIIKINYYSSISNVLDLRLQISVAMWYPADTTHSAVSIVE